MNNTEIDALMREILFRHYDDYAYYRDVEWMNSPASYIKSANLI